MSGDNPALSDRRLADRSVGVLATVDSQGRPHQVPIVFAVLEDSLFTPIDGKPKSGREPARVRNIRARPEVSVLVDHYAEDWAQLWWIRVDGRARIWSPEKVQATPRLQSALEALKGKYPQYARVPVLHPEGCLIEIRIERVSSWSAS